MVGVFHRIGEPSKDHMVNSLDQIIGFDGQITFDGGDISIYRHRKVLAERKPTLFVLDEAIGGDNEMSWDEIIELQNMGFILGWHGWTHRRLPELTDRQITNELMKPMNIFYLYAYPHGDFDERTARLIKQAGYTKAYSTTQGEEGNDFAIPRIYI